MFATATKRPAVPSFEGFGQFLSHLVAAFAGARAASRTYDRLSRLSDEQLAARGLTRNDVARLTLEALETGVEG